MPITYQGGIRSFVFGIMATEDNVQVQISEYDDGVYSNDTQHDTQWF
ncbi:hypothetical protein N9233_01420 [Flavobacteriales bacterium]|nr:hypothetical protein [Flavobacteriales bacterium]